MSKKGLSPLIATVLLIAFAVALGVMIMTWTQNFPGGGTASCSEVILEQQNICFTGEEIRLQIRNSGDIEIGGVALEISDQIKDVNLKLKNSKIPKGANFNRDIGFDKVGNARVEIVALLDDGGQLTQCPRPEIVINLLPTC